jgi:4'-phosphopantetheinyl transferase
MDAGTVHVWHVDLAEDWDRFAHTLSADERLRAERYAIPQPGRHFRRCRAALRVLLAHYRGGAPADLAFRYGRFGKPELVGSSGSLHFNVSHSGEQALIAIAGSLIGVDIESARRGIDVEQLIDLVCHPQEKPALAALPAERRASAFYRLWTRKEAYCKARGAGLQLSLPSIRFHSGDAHTAAVVDDALKAESAWWVHDLEAQAGHVASLCVAQPSVRIAHRSVRAAHCR